MKKRKILTLLAAALFLSLALYGCKGDTDSKSGTAETQAPSSESDSLGEPVYGGSVVVGITQDLDSLDPHKAVAAGTKEVLFNIFEGLVKPDEEGNLVPAVASDYTISEDGTVYTFILRDGVKFHNGKLVTAEDVIYSIKRCAGLLETTDAEVKVETALANIKEVTAKDEKTIEIVLKEGDIELIGYLTCAIIPCDYDQQATQPVGTGPFKFKSYQPLESVELEKNAEYWDSALPYLNEVKFQISSNTDAAFLQLEAGAIDIFPYLTEDQAKQLETTFRIETGHMNLVQALFLNNKAEPFTNEKVREALNYAIDKQGIIDMVSGGKGTILGSNMFSGLSKYYLAELEDYYPYDVNKAKELLKEAGYENGFTFTITVPSNYQFHVDTAQIIVEQLKQAGITAEIELVEWSAWLEEVYVGRNYQSTIIGLDAKLSPRDLMERYTSTASNNFMNFNSAAYDEIIEKAIKSTNETEKIEYYYQLQKILAEDSASVYLQDPPLMVAVNKKLGGYKFYPVYVQDMAHVYYMEE
ncbi:ABC transporter substrate-binding protein [Anaeromicropila populeti]|uniref:Peptide/nickel transport system substrate-binding protein n=1 Tax=Anaeromicropila populeti TaxID=37658 RepID=A0A1I6HUF7_9FIRM|nr:ABC transporter substrate-binding protein [Anaeromicropila populeti]SFR58048.1 peptide/nickel transport system substrate-binding protein [Anaeromicropila populeti]